MQKKTINIIVIVLVVSVISVGAFSLFSKDRGNAPSEYTEDTEITEYRGEKYLPKENIETVLLMGLDKFDMEADDIAYINMQQSDLMLLFVIDHNSNQCELLHINRDTMTEIQRLGVGGDKAGTFTGQICLAHSYGSGDADSNINAVTAVEGLLGHNITIDHYISLTMEAVSILNDAVGGVPVEITEDMTNTDPEFVNGSTVTLTGEQALKFVRARGELADDSNLSRMERQQKYMDSFTEKLMESIASDSSFMKKMILKINPYMKSDISANGLEVLGETLGEAERMPLRTIKGEAKQGKKFTEFYADEEDLEKNVMELFFEKTE